MRIAFFLLVLANLLFLVWGGDYLGGKEEGREPQRLRNQLHPEKMKVTLALPAAAAAATATTTAPPSACRRIEGVAAKDAGALQQALLGAGLVAAVLPAAEPNYWVTIPALPNKAAADKKAGELKFFGVGDFHVMPGEGGTFVISLGLFRDEAAATQFLQILTKKGVKSAHIETRTKPAPTTRLEVRGAADVLAKRLPELLSAAAGATVADCP